MISPQQIKRFKGEKEHIMKQIHYLDKDSEDYEDEVESYSRQLITLAKRERVAYRDDLIQPDDDGFKKLYREQWLEREKEKEIAELKAKRIKVEQDEFYKHNLHEGRDKVKTALDLEDKIRHGN